MTAIRHPRPAAAGTVTNSRGMWEPRYTWIAYRESRGLATDTGGAACDGCGCLLEPNPAHSPKCVKANA